jgi:hypothetical protein
MNPLDNDLEIELTDMLSRSSVRLADPGAAAIVKAGRHRVNRRRSAYGAFVAATMVATGGVVATRFRSEGPNVVTRPKSDDTEPVSTVAASVGRRVPGGGPAAPMPDLPKSSIEWERIDPKLAIGGGFGVGAKNFDGTFLSVSTEPARADGTPSNGDFQPTVYTSSDGVEWKPLGTSLPPGIGYPMDPMLSDGSLYVVGTAAALAPIPENGAGELVVAESKAGGAWKNVVLPIDLRSVVKHGGQVQNISSTIVKRGNTTVVAASVSVDPAVLPLIMKKGLVTEYGINYVGDKVEVYAPPSPEMLACQRQLEAGSPVTTVSIGGSSTTVSATIPVPTTATLTVGVASTIVGPNDMPVEVSKECQALFDRPPTVAATYTLAELGVDPAVIAQAGTRTHVFVSTAGSAFSEVALPESRIPVALEGGGGSTLLAYDEGFVITRGQINGKQIATEVLLSVDGKTWQAGESLDGFVTSIGVVAGLPTLSWQRPQDGPAPEIAAIRADGSVEKLGSWPHPVSDFGGGSDVIAFGEAGVIGVAGTRSNSFEPQSVDFDGVTYLMENTDTGQFVHVTDTATGQVLIDRVAIQDQTLSIPAHGNVKASTVRFEDVFQHLNWASQASYVKSMQILDSPDGKTWTSTKLSDLIDLNVDQVISVGNIIVDKDKYIVNLSIAPQTGSIPKTITLVGRRK